MIEETQELFNPLIECLGYPVAYENIHFKPGESPWIRVRYLESPSLPFTLGCDLSRGIVQADVMVPDGSGAVDAGAIADIIIKAFPITTRLNDGNGFEVVIIRKPFPGPANQNNGWYQKPVSIPYEVQ